MRLIVVCSWHVLSRDNIARVKRDEAEARALEAKKEEQVALAVSVLCGWGPVGVLCGWGPVGVLCGWGPS